MGLDQLFKELLHSFLRDFLALFFPEVEARLDFERLHFLETESFTSFPEGSSREADVVAQLETRDGRSELVLVHVEVQARKERDFARRMFEYYALLWTKYQISIFPIAVYVRGGRVPYARKSFGWSSSGKSS